MIWKVMIVDDDRNFRYAMKEVIPWEAHGFRVVKEAIHGAEAWEYLETHPCDIVLTDMEMPVLNGVELTKKIKDAFPDMIVIALSAYDDFGFVRDSMRLGAADYILKQEFNPDEIIGKMEKLCAAYQSERSRALSHSESQQEFVTYLQKGKPEISTENAFSALRGVEQMMLILVHGADDSEPTAEGISSFGRERDPGVEAFLRIKTDEWIFICSISKTASRAKEYQKLEEMIRLIQRGFSGPVYLAVSDEAGMFSSLPGQYDRAEEIMVNRIYHPEQAVFHFHDLRTQNRVRDYKVTDLPEDKLQEQDAAAEIGRFCADMQTYLPDEEYLNRNFSAFCENLCGRLGIARSEEETIQYYQKVSGRSTLDEKAEFTRQYIEQELGEKHSGYQGTNPLIEKVIDYIIQNYAAEITLSEVAAQAGRSENYISNLFKKETGENLTHYINKVRIKNAQYLLRHSDLRVYEIAERCGFRNSAYFTTTFRKYTGMSLSEYRKASADH